VLTVHDERIDVGPVRLAISRTGPEPTAPEAQRPVLLVHGLASNARLWDGVAQRLGSAGHPVVAVDQRGHGRSDVPPDGYDTQTCAADLSALIATLGWTGARAPVVAGQSWGGNVVLNLAARHGKVAAIALVDGGWLRPGARFATFEECWQVLAPPSFEGMRYSGLAAQIAARHPDWPPEAIAGTLANLVELDDGGVRARLAREHHKSILRSLWQDDPRELYPQVSVPVLLMPADAQVGSAPVVEAAQLLPDCRVSEYVGADHDLHAQHPARCALDLHDLAVRADAREGVSG
jgi:pimeloyl-ACP methyl ester carboxylesterase